MQSSKGKYQALSGSVKLPDFAALCLMKKFYLYRQRLLSLYANDPPTPNKGEWHFDDSFTSYEAALAQAKINAAKSSWKVWKIEEVWDFSAGIVIITKEQVQKLREDTGVGMLECKYALEKHQGDYQSAIQFLRTRGHAVALK